MFGVGMFEHARLKRIDFGWKRSKGLKSVKKPRKYLITGIIEQKLNQ